MEQGSRIKYQLVLSIIGLIDSIYLTVYHYLNLPLICPGTGAVDCATVLNSRFAVFFGFPTAILGVIFFAVIIALLLMKKEDYVLYWNTMGFFFLFYLWYAEYVIGKICLYCTLIHVLVLLLLALSVYPYRDRLFKK